VPLVDKGLPRHLQFGPMGEPSSTRILMCGTPVGWKPVRPVKPDAIWFKPLSDRFKRLSEGLVPEVMDAVALWPGARWYEAWCRNRPRRRFWTVDGEAARLGCASIEPRCRVSISALQCWPLC